jgi:DNA polymerase-1
LEAEGYEADDVIGTLAKVAEQQGFTTYMMTPDKDFGQLVSENIKMFKPARSGGAHEVWGEEEVCEKFDLDNVNQIIDYLGLMGDAVDNIPGVPGVGPKTASKLLKQYGTMEGIYEHIDELKGKLKERLVDNKEQAFISRQLATILLDAPVPFEPEKLIKEDPNEDKLKELFTELEFRTMFKRVIGSEMQQTVKTGQQSLFDDFAPSAASSASKKKTTTLQTIETSPHEYGLIQLPIQREQLLKKLLKQDVVCFDTETTSLDVLDAEILGCAFSFEKGSGYYVTFPRDQQEAKEVLDEFLPFFQSDQIVKVLQNAKYDMHILRNYGMNLKGPIYDTMLAHYLIEPDERHNMDFLAEKYLNYKPISITELIGKRGKNQLSFDTVEIQKAKEYAVEDADITLQIKNQLEPLVKEEEVEHILKDIELPLVPVLMNMEREGVNVDVPFLESYSTQLKKESEEIEASIYEEAGLKFNIGSPRQLGEVLFDVLNLDPKAKKTKTGQYKTGEDVLQKLADKHALPKLALEYRQVNKLLSTYVDALPKLVHPRTGRVHTTFSQAIAGTGRLSSNHPNLQNIPIRTERGREIRKAFVPRDDEHVLLAADYSQIELRIVASVSGDENMVQAFKDGLDIHTATAAKVFDVDLENVTSDMRRKAKTVNFGLIYGVGATSLGQQLGIPRREASELIDAYFTQFSGIKKYMDNTIEYCRDHGYVKTLLGRKRKIRDINSQNRVVVGFAERNAINAPIQGAAADMIKVAMIHIHEALEKSKLNTKMILQVHDELLFDVPKSELEETKALVMPLMEKAMPLNVPVVVEAGVGKHWLEAH